MVGRAFREKLWSILEKHCPCMRKASEVSSPSLPQGQILSQNEGKFLTEIKSAGMRQNLLIFSSSRYKSYWIEFDRSGPETFTKNGYFARASVCRRWNGQHGSYCHSWDNWKWWLMMIPFWMFLPNKCLIYSMYFRERAFREVDILDWVVCTKMNHRYFWAWCNTDGTSDYNHNQSIQ